MAGEHNIKFVNSSSSDQEDPLNTKDTAGDE
jgi:hypothetical protein